MAELLCSLAWGGKFDALVKLLDNNMKLINEPNRRGQSALVRIFFPLALSPSTVEPDKDTWIL